MLIEKICEKESIACDFRRVDGYLFTPDGGSSDLLELELKAAHRAGLLGVSRLKRMPVPTLSRGPCLRFTQQGQCHPLQYLKGLASAFMKDGGRIYSGAFVVDVVGGMPARVVTKSGHEIEADAVVVASNTPLNDRFVIHTKQEAYRSYVVGIEVPLDSIPIALYWDTLNPYHFVRVHREAGVDLLMVGGEDHRTGQSQDERDSLSRLEAWARAHFPKAGRTTFRWSGQVEETLDGLAYIGRNPGDADNVFIATGDSGMGMTHGTIAARLITDLILGRENAYAKLYDPSRKTILATKRWLKENLNTAAQYGDYFTKGEVDSIHEIGLGQGAILRRGLTKVAVFRDSEGTTHELSATCPHLWGIVRWNQEEKTWDCPCHGSRFSALGKVLCGPATANLEPAKREKGDRANPSLNPLSPRLAG